MSYAKLFSTITESSLWSASKETRLLFVSMLARSNAAGFVEASVPGLARMSNLTREETEGALRDLTAPDADDKSGNNEGRRLVKMDGGWGIVNYEVYRNRRDEEERREYMRTYMAQYRKRPVNSVSSGKPGLAQAEAALEVEVKAEAEACVDESDLCSASDMAKARAIMASDKATASRPTLAPAKSFRDFRSVHGRCFIGKDERDDWESLYKTWGWDVMADMHATLKDDRIYLNSATAWLSKNWKL